MTVFNPKVVDFTKEPMFFGEAQNTQRYDAFKYPIFDKLTDTQHGYFWRPTEISLQKDRNDFASLQPEQKFIFTANLKYQTLLDSVQGRAPALAFLPYVSIPELEACIETWSFFELIHSRSYTYIIKNCYPNPSEVFDTILIDPEIVARAKSVTRHYDEFIRAARRFEVYNEMTAATSDYSTDLHQEFKPWVPTLYELKKKLYMALISVNILEGIRFYVSFACTFAFGELKLMEGAAKILTFIARDESQHLAITQNILKFYKSGENDPEMLKIIEECEPEVYALYKEAVEQEKRWAAYLFKDGSLIGLNEKLLCQYVEYIANRRMKTIGLKPMFDVTQSPLPWMQNWLSSKGVQVAPQEAELSSYVVGGVKQDVAADMFKDFKL